MEHLVESNGVQLWCETFGDPKDPAVLLIMGLGATGTAWPDALCTALSDGGRYVIRYDNRDTGLSGKVDFAAQPYTSLDLAADAVGLLDGLGVSTAHVVGASMGGMIAQEIALEHPGRLQTLTVIMSSANPLDPTTGTFRGATVDPRVAAWMQRGQTDPPLTEEARIAHQLELARILTGSATEFDEAATRQIIARDAARAGASAAHAMQNHTAAAFASRDRSGLIASITTPTLVIHGTEDPMAPFEHGKEIADKIPGAVFLPLEGMGHVMPSAFIPTISEAILKHTN
ncbi:alpha/beta fold hydrolase [Sinosporangium siamense]|uniref:AB hydrolase-1 domain-containing protein n=1 Tax=Sinosporangium siamense TaxID=1367973 RepID=A0A919V6M2_9ACTN|nr:alpha/beta hydrolase [Sinosporangium siamense]GII92146.1 hypothetical protein Ssi02_23770 [Sinosporangium siamense]